MISYVTPCFHPCQQIICAYGGSEATIFSMYSLFRFGAMGCISGLSDPTPTKVWGGWRRDSHSSIAAAHCNCLNFLALSARRRIIGSHLTTGP